jgi:hypothetical protein
MLGTDNIIIIIIMDQQNNNDRDREIENETLRLLLESISAQNQESYGSSVPANQRVANASSSTEAAHDPMGSSLPCNPLAAGVPYKESLSVPTAPSNSAPHLVAYSNPLPAEALATGGATNRPFWAPFPQQATPSSLPSQQHNVVDTDDRAARVIAESLQQQTNPSLNNIPLDLRASPQPSPAPSGLSTVSQSLMEQQQQQQQQQQQEQEQQRLNSQMMLNMLLSQVYGQNPNSNMATLPPSWAALMQAAGKQQQQQQRHQSAIYSHGVPSNQHSGSSNWDPSQSFPMSSLAASSVHPNLHNQYLSTLFPYITLPSPASQATPNRAATALATTATPITSLNDYNNIMNSGAHRLMLQAEEDELRAKYERLAAEHRSHNNYTKMHESFPVKLHRLLQQVAAEGKEDIISWTFTGKAFKVHDRERFVKEIVPQYFRQKKISSFRRQLSMYGFDRIPRGPEEGSYQHKLFHRDRPDWAAQIVRIKDAPDSERSETWKPDFDDLNLL